MTSSILLLRANEASSRTAPSVLMDEFEPFRRLKPFIAFICPPSADVSKSVKSGGDSFTPMAEWEGVPCQRQNKGLRLKTPRKPLIETAGEFSGCENAKVRNRQAEVSVCVRPVLEGGKFCAHCARCSQAYKKLFGSMAKKAVELALHAAGWAPVYYVAQINAEASTSSGRGMG